MTKDELELPIKVFINSFCAVERCKEFISDGINLKSKHE